MDGNLAQYIKPEYRNISYFSGIDYHMDLLDYANFNGDYITLYIYLTDVTGNQSPLNIISKSHIYGATHFPHYLKLKIQIHYFIQLLEINMINLTRKNLFLKKEEYICGAH